MEWSNVMKIAGLTPLQIIAAIIIGIVAAVAVGSLTAPHPVETPPIVVTPVPTPAPVYITVAPTPVQQVVYIVQGTPEPTPNLYPEGSPEYTFISLLPIMVVGIGIFTILIGAFAIRD